MVITTILMTIFEITRKVFSFFSDFFLTFGNLIPSSNNVIGDNSALPTPYSLYSPYLRIEIFSLILRIQRILRHPLRGCLHILFFLSFSLHSKTDIKEVGEKQKEIKIKSLKL